ncbi:MAG: PorV/PorQ family protein [Calditrichaceae bacterium]
MDHSKNICMAFIVLCLLTMKIYAGDAGNNGFALLKLDVDARAAGMGGAYTAIAEDASAVYWNPAGLAGAKSRSFTIMHHAWIKDFSHDFAAAQLKTGKHNIGISVNLLTFSDIEIRDLPTEEPYGTTDAITFAGMLSYATNVYDDYAAGINIKYLFEKLYLEKSSGWAIDLGVRKKDVISGMDLGAAIQNIGQLSKLKRENTPLPFIIRGGVGYHLPVKLMDNMPVLAADVQYIRDESVYYHLGSQVDIYQYLAVRFGWVIGGGQNQPAFGFSLKYSAFHFNYSYSVAKYKLVGQQHISMGFIF